MKLSSKISSLAVALAFVTGPAHASIALDANLAAPGVYYGTGNANGHFTVNTTAAGDELGIRAHVYQQNPTSPVGSTYNFALGQIISFDWSINPVSNSLAGITSIFTLTNLATGGTASWDALLVPDNATSSGGEQNSWRLSFGFLNGGPGNIGNISYNANVDSTYNATWTVNGLDGGPQSVSATFVQGNGAAVPEPATWAMLLLGFGVVGAAMRRRHNVRVNFA